MTQNKSGKMTYWKQTKKTTKSTFKKVKKTVGKGVASSKTYLAGVEKKLTPQQRLLGKRLPKALWKTAKWAWRAPISASALIAAPMIVKSVGKNLPRMKFASGKNWTKKGRWYL